MTARRRAGPKPWGEEPEQVYLPASLAPAPPLLLGGMYLLALVPLFGLLLLKPYEVLALRQMRAEGRQMAALHVTAHGRGALIIAAVWTVAFLGRHLLLDVITEILAL